MINRKSEFFDVAGNLSFRMSFLRSVRSAFSLPADLPMRLRVSDDVAENLSFRMSFLQSVQSAFSLPADLPMRLRVSEGFGCFEPILNVEIS